MTLHALAKERNVKSSLKKFFLDNLGENAVTFDTSLSAPDIRSQEENVVTQWYNVDFGNLGRQTLSEYLFNIYCMSREDPEGDNLAVMVDTVMGLLVDSTITDGMGRIPFYDTSVVPWVQITSMIVQDVVDVSLEETEDETKIKMLSVRLRWGTII